MSDKTPIQAEAAGDEFTTVSWRDLQFDVPRDPDEWPLEAGLAMEDGKNLSFVRALVPAEQFRRFMATNPKNRDAGDLADAIAQALGFKSTGESAASSD